MKVVGLGPHIVVTQREGTPSRDEVLDYQDPIVPPVVKTPKSDKTNPEEKKKDPRSLFDLIKEAEKRKKVRMRSGDRRREQIIAKYVKLAKSEAEVPERGSLVKKEI